MWTRDNLNRWHPIHMPCPLCVRDGKYDSEEWTHGGACGGRLWIDSHSIVHCERCGKSAKISSMRFSCNSGRHPMSLPQKKCIAGALLMGKVGCEDGHLSWFKRLLENIQR